MPIRHLTAERKRILTVLSHLERVLIIIKTYCLFILWTACTQSPITKKVILPTEELPTFEAFDFSLKQINIHGKQVDFRAAHIKQFQEGETSTWECSEGGEFYKYNDSGKVASYIRAEYVHYSEENKEWLLKRDVYGYGENKDTIQTEELRIDETNDKVWSDKLTIIRRKDGAKTIAKGGFKSNTSLSEFEMYQISGEEPVNVKNIE